MSRNSFNFKQFFNQIEEKILFPFGRRTWQILSVCSILLLLLGAIWFIYNARPGAPIRVKVDKWEVVENEIDTIDYSKNKESNCSKELINTSLTKLKEMIPLLEWDSLGSYQVRTFNLKDRFGNDIYTKNSWLPIKVKKHVFVPNENAVPNLLNEIFKSRYIDSLDYCAQLQVLSSIQLLVSLYNPDFLQSEPRFKDLCSQFEYHRRLDEFTINDAIRLNKMMDFGFISISNKETLKRFYQILDYVLLKGIKEEELLQAEKVITANRNLGFDDEESSDEYFLVFKILQSSAVENPKQLKRAIDDFTKEIKFYHEIGLVKSLKRYLKLYDEKLNWRENQKSRDNSIKAENRLLAITTAGIALLTICVLTIILLLFSIQNMLKKGIENKV